MQAANVDWWQNQQYENYKRFHKILEPINHFYVITLSNKQIKASTYQGN